MQCAKGRSAGANEQADYCARVEPPACDVEFALRHARTALDAGQAEQARELAQQVLGIARASNDVHLEARAFACLAHCDRLMSMLRRAGDASRRAAHLFQSVGDTRNEAAALSTLSHVSAFLGRHDEAVEAALLSVQLCEAQPLGAETVLAYNYLGVAYCWSGSFDDAQDALEHARQIAAMCSPPVNPFQPASNSGWVEAIRIVHERYRTGQMQCLDQLRAFVMAARELETGACAGSPLQGYSVTAHAMSEMLAALLCCWTGERDRAHIHLAGARDWIQKYGRTTWLVAFARWIEAELAWLSGDWDAVGTNLREMAEVATQAGYEQLAGLSHLLACTCHEQQGNFEAAADEMRRLRSRELRIRAEGLKSRERVVRLQLDLRRSQLSLQNLAATSAQFERWSLEDALTGIPNRRCFEPYLAEQLGAAASSPSESLSLALVDVDRFKAVNDQFGHLVGDKVLQTLASALSREIREDDMAARLSGDEFVILLRRADERVASQICERIRAGVRDFDWSSIASGLQVSVSIGVCQTLPGDTVETLLHRSDLAMYAGKAARVK